MKKGILRHVVCTTVFIQQEELSEQQVRVGLIEKKLENANRDGDDRVDRIQRKLDEAKWDMLKEWTRSGTLQDQVANKLSEWLDEELQQILA